MNKKWIFSGMALALMNGALATTSYINDSLAGLPETGTQIGGFLDNIRNPVGSFIFYFALIAGVAGILGAIIYAVKEKVHL